MIRTLTALFMSALALLAGTSASWADQPLAVQASPCKTTETDVVPSASGREGKPLAGRIGSTRDEFEAIYGLPTEDDGHSSVTYSFEGCDDTRVSYVDDTYIDHIVLYSPRGMAGKLSDPSRPLAGDWTLNEAQVIAERFIPTDGNGGRFRKADGGYHSLTGTSETLERSVPLKVWEYVDNTPVIGGYTVTLVTSGVDSVVWIDISLQVGD